jgi:hypothetical protein
MNDFKLKANTGMRILKLLPKQVLYSMPADVIEHYKFNVDNILTEFESQLSPAKEVNDWKQIESDFYKWTKSKWCPTHEQILNWMRDKLQSLSKDNTIHDKIKPHISDEEAVVSKWIRKDNLREEILKFLDFAEPIYYGENEYTDYHKILELYLYSK